MALCKYMAYEIIGTKLIFVNFFPSSMLFFSPKNEWAMNLQMSGVAQLKGALLFFK